MKLDDLKNKRILIVGYGREGRAVEEFLKNKVPTAI
jgi:UDP-N-acetylmuramoylalanine-D-glutamate ligase